MSLERRLQGSLLSARPSALPSFAGCGRSQSGRPDPAGNRLGMQAAVRRAAFIGSVLVACIVIRRCASLWKRAALLLSLVTITAPARAEGDSPNPDPPDKSGYDLFDPTPDSEMRRFAPDRPTKGYSVRTIDAGHFELEMDFANYSVTKYLGVTTRSIQALDPTFKFGLTNWMDFEIQFNGLQFERSFDSGSGTGTHGGGFGDVILRTKVNLFGNDSGSAGLALIPYVKLPSSAPTISNGAVEGGLIAPLALRLPQDYLVTLMTEVDALKDPNDSGRYVNFVNLVGVSHPLPGIEGANAMVELFASTGTTPATPPVYTFDIGTNFRLDEHVIFDVGLNLGLNDAAPKAQIYAGISVRF
jgi:Putative MetA-pathway of phenol degradation